MSASIRIAHVVSTYPPYRGGQGRVAFEYVERLRARGIDAQAFIPDWGGKEPPVPQVRRLRAWPKIGNAAYVPGLMPALRGFDIVHLHYPFFGGAIPAAIGSRHALAMTYHMDPVAPGPRGACFAAYQSLALPWIAKRADRILASTRGYAGTSALARLPGALAKTEIHPLGVDLSRYHPGDEPMLRAELGLPAGGPLVLFVGGLDPAHHFKGLSFLIEALGGLEDVTWTAAIVGTGSLRRGFESRARQLGIQGRLRFLGDVRPELLARLYRLADVHVFPSTGRGEAFGLVNLEAAASGTPTVASSLPGVREVIVDGKTGILVPPRNVPRLGAAIHRLLTDRALRDRLGKTARRRAERHFGWETCIDRLLSTYETLL